MWDRVVDKEWYWNIKKNWKVRENCKNYKLGNDEGFNVREVKKEGVDVRGNGEIYNFRKIEI